MNIDTYLEWPYQIETEPEGIALIVKNDGSVEGITNEFDTCCTSINEVEEMVKSVIIDFAEFCFYEKIPFPAPGKIENGDKVFTLPSDFALKIAIHNKTLKDNNKQIKSVITMNHGVTQ